MTHSITGRMAATLVNRQASETPADVLAKAQLCLVDFLSGAFEAAPLEWSQQAASIALPMADGAACIPGKTNTVPGDAAFANAVASHGLVREDMHTGSIAHMGVVIWPALLASLSQAKQPVSGRDFLLAGIAGYEVGGRIGDELMDAALARLFRPTGMIGAVASAAACGMLNNLNAEQLAVALGLAVNTAAGFNEWPHSGGSEMYFHAGFASRNGMAAVQLAQAGAFAAPTVLEGQAGLFQSIGRRAAPDDIALFVNGAHEIMSVFHKQAPACNFAQTPCQAALKAALQFDGSVSDITKIDVRTTKAARLYPGCDHAGPFGNVLHAKMSIQYGIAATISARAMSEANYGRIGDPEIDRLIGLISIETDDGFTAAYPAKQGASVTITTKDGQSYTGTLDDILKADAPEVNARFVQSSQDWLGAAQSAQLNTFITEILTSNDVRPLNGLCIPAS